MISHLQIQCADLRLGSSYFNMCVAIILYLGSYHAAPNFEARGGAEEANLRLTLLKQEYEETKRT